jgi:alpha-amylase
MKETEVYCRKSFCMAVLAAGVISACSEDSQRTEEGMQPAKSDMAGAVFVHLFEWRWPDVAVECEKFLGPHGYKAVQVSPPQEHVPGPQWWTRYQPVSYLIESRGGTRAEFADMVQRCKAAGVDVYADAISNHMADIGEGTGVAGSRYTEFSYPVPYGYDDFHHCGRNGDDRILNYQDLWEVQHCNMGVLPDLDTANPEVREKIAAYLKDLLGLGVTGFRLDAAKHVPQEEIQAYLALLDTRPFLYQEVIDRGGEPINAMDYLVNGPVTEFKYPQAMFEAFEGRQLDSLSDFDMQAGYLPADKAIVFVDNHDVQRGHAGGEDILNYKDGDLYDLANVFMLGWPYGYPMVMSSYEFDDSDQGPPQSSPVDDNGCVPGWVCEHRRTSRTGMVEFRKVTAGMPVTDWQAFGDEVISFGRGDKGHLVINISTETVNGTFVTRMSPGEYCNVLHGSTTENDCVGPIVRIDDGVLQLSLKPMSAVAIHSAAIK